MEEDFHGLPMEIVSEDDETYIVDSYEATLESVEKLWETYQKNNIILSDHGRGTTKEEFIQNLLSPAYIILSVEQEGEGPVGVFYANDLLPGIQAQVHYVFWDRRTAGRQRLVLSTIDWFMDAFDFHRLYMEVHIYAYAALRRIKSIGFRIEGRLRESVLYRGNWIDQLVFGVTEDEVTEEAIEKGELERTEAEKEWHGLLEADEPFIEAILRKS